VLDSCFRHFFHRDEINQDALPKKSASTLGLDGSTIPSKVHTRSRILNNSTEEGEFNRGVAWHLSYHRIGYSYYFSSCKGKSQ